MALDQEQLAKPDTGATTIGDGNSITRCNIRNCAVTSSWLKRCTFEDCALARVRSARRTTASKSHLHDVFAVKRSELFDSAITGRSSVYRSEVKSSTVQEATRIKSSTVKNSRVQKSDIWRASVTDCDVTECAIYRSDFKGMVLKYGIWKRGQLVGRVGTHEPVMISKDGTQIPALELSTDADIPAAYDRDTKTRLPEFSRGHNQDSDMSSDSDDSDNEQDLPPPYKV